MISSNAAGAVTFDAVTGGFDLTVTDASDITFADTVGTATIPLTGITMTADDDITINGVLTATGDVTLKTGGAAGNDITVAANVIGSTVEFDVTTGATSGTIIVNANLDNTSSNLIFDGDTTLNADAVSGARTIFVASGGSPTPSAQDVATNPNNKNFRFWGGLKNPSGHVYSDGSPWENFCENIVNGLAV